MWSYFLANYAKFAFMFMGVLVLLKILLTVLFQNYERNVIGIVSSIFKWYGIIDRDMAETGAQRFIMQLQNFITIFLFAIAGVLVFMQLLF
jgi:hypothetical protein